MKYRVFETKTDAGWQPREVVFEEADKSIWRWAMRRQEYMPVSSASLETVTPEGFGNKGAAWRASVVLDAPDGTSPSALRKPIRPSQVAATWEPVAKS